MCLAVLEKHFEMKWVQLKHWIDFQESNKTIDLRHESQGVLEQEENSGNKKGKGKGEKENQSCMD